MCCHGLVSQEGSSQTVVACRSRAKAVSGFQEGLQSIAVKGASWDLQQPVSDAAMEIDAHINKLRAQKVRTALVASLAGSHCQSPASGSPCSLSQYSLLTLASEPGLHNEFISRSCSRRVSREHAWCHHGASITRQLRESLRVFVPCS